MADYKMTKLEWNTPELEVLQILDTEAAAGSVNDGSEASWGFSTDHSGWV